MKYNDVTILDSYLAKTLAFLRERWYAPDTGCVAACLLSDVAPIYDVSRDVGHNLYSHAERNVLETYVREQGRCPPENSVLVTTLSPCVGSTSWRVGESCSNLIADYGITRLHVGLVNSDHAPHADNMPAHSFKVTQTKDQDLATQCVNLRGLFNLKAQQRPDGTRERLIKSYKEKSVYNAVFGS